MRRFGFLALAVMVELSAAGSAHAGNLDWVNQVNGKGRGIEGPNCFSAAMMQITGKPEIRYVASEELAYWTVKSGRCEIVKDANAKQPGDVVVIYDGTLDDDTGLGHAFVYLGKNQVISKNGNGQGALSDVPYLVQTPQQMFVEPKLNNLLRYGFSVEDWNNNRCQTPDTSSGCAKLARIFRCKQGDVVLSADGQQKVARANTILKKFYAAAKSGNLDSRDDMIGEIAGMEGDLESKKEKFTPDGAVSLRLESAQQAIHDYYTSQ